MHPEDEGHSNETRDGIKIRRPLSVYMAHRQLTSLMRSVQWRRNEFESWGGMSSAEPEKNFVVSLHFFWLYKYNWSFW